MLQETGVPASVSPKCFFVGSRFRETLQCHLLLHSRLVLVEYVATSSMDANGFNHVPASVRFFCLGVQYLKLRGRVSSLSAIIVMPEAFRRLLSYTVSFFSLSQSLLNRSSKTLRSRKLL